MEANFNVPQRQSIVGILILFFDTIQQYARALFPVLIIYVFKFNEMNKLWLLLGTLVVIVLIAVIAYFKYLNFTFYLDQINSEFVITEGIFSKTKTAIQLHKIQQVNIKQSFIQRIIGVYALDIDTAGSNEKEVSIKAISHELALDLKSKLLDNENKTSVETGTQASEAIENAPTPFIQISVLSLFKMAVTSNYVRSFALLLAFVITVWEKINNYSDDTFLSKDNITSYVDTNLMLQSIVVLVLLLFVVVIGINIFRIVFRYFDYNITKQKGSLLLSFGLFNTKSTIIKPEKVQIVSVTRNYFQKKFDILELKIKQATSGEKEERKQAVEIPGCNQYERDAILKLLFGEIPEKGVMLKPNFRKLVFAIFLAIVVPLCGFYAVAFNAKEDFFQFGYLIPIYVIFALLILTFGFRNYRLFISNRFIIKQSGAWDISNEIIAPQKIQALTVSQLFWHKSADIGYLTIHTAGGNLDFQLGNFTVIKQYVNLWLYEIETSDSNWI